MMVLKEFESAMFAPEVTEELEQMRRDWNRWFRLHKEKSRQINLLVNSNNEMKEKLERQEKYFPKVRIEGCSGSPDLICAVRIDPRLLKLVDGDKFADYLHSDILDKLRNFDETKGSNIYVEGM